MRKKVLRILTALWLLLALTACSLDIPTKSANEETKKPRESRTSAAEPLPGTETAPGEETAEVAATTAVPKTTAAPETTAVPETTKVPETTVVPETAAVPATSAIPETTAAPETTAVPETTAAPETTAVPETTAAPETTAEPETPASEETAPPESEPAVTVQPGELLVFGRYEQDGIVSNGQEEIQWIVLSVEGDKALLLSRYCLDCLKAHEKDANVTWETSDIRKWLNGTFLETAFTKEEQEAVCTVNLSNQANPQSGAGAAGDTKDRIFLLSIEEVELFLADEFYDWRGTTPTRYAMDRGSTLASNGNTWWWLRTSGRDLKSFAEVFSYREIDYMGDPAVNPEQAVRPAVVIDLSKLADD